MTKSQFLNKYKGKIVVVNNIVDLFAYGFYLGLFFGLKDFLSFQFARWAYAPAFPTYLRTLFRNGDRTAMSENTPDSDGTERFGQSPNLSTYTNKDGFSMPVVPFVNDVLVLSGNGFLLDASTKPIPRQLEDASFILVDGVTGRYVKASMELTKYTSVHNYPATVVGFYGGKNVIRWLEGDDKGKISLRLWEDRELHDIVPRFKVGDRVNYRPDSRGPFSSRIATIAVVRFRPFDSDHGWGYQLNRDGEVLSAGAWYWEDELRLVEDFVVKTASFSSFKVGDRVKNSSCDPNGYAVITSEQSGYFTVTYYNTPEYKNARSLSSEVVVGHSIWSSSDLTPYTGEPLPSDPAYVKPVPAERVFSAASFDKNVRTIYGPTDWAFVSDGLTEKQMGDYSLMTDKNWMVDPKDFVKFVLHPLSTPPVVTRKEVYIISVDAHNGRGKIGERCFLFSEIPANLRETHKDWLVQWSETNRFVWDDANISRFSKEKYETYVLAE